MAHPDAALIGVRTGTLTMIVAVVIDLAGMAWFARHFGRFPATRVHSLPGGGYELIYRMPLPPLPIIGCPQALHNRLADGITVTGEGGWIPWPAPSPYEDTTPGYRLVHEVPVAPLPRWIVRRVTMAAPAARAPVSFQPPRRGLDMQLDMVHGFIVYSLQRTAVERTRLAGRALGRGLVAQGLLREWQAVDLVAGAAEEAGLERRAALTAARCGVKRGVLYELTKSAKSRPLTKSTN